MADASFTLVMPAGQSLDAIEWRAVPGFPDYEVSEYGHLRKLKAGHKFAAGEIRSPYRGARGYPVYGLAKDGQKVHLGAYALVALAFIGPRPPGRECAHWDGVPLNCHYTNLRWATRAENIADRVRHGTAVRGERHGAARLSEGDVRRIRGLAGQASYMEMARQFGVAKRTVADAVTGKTWRHL